MNWDWQVFCQDTITQEVGQSCFGKNGDITYLDWMLSAWGWTVSVSLLSVAVALVVGSLVGTLRTLEGRPAVIITFLDGLSPRRPNVRQCRALGEGLAKMHLALADIAMTRENSLGPKAWAPLWAGRSFKTSCTSSAAMSTSKKIAQLP
jgi:hypothetical protein